MVMKDLFNKLKIKISDFYNEDEGLHKEHRIVCTICYTAITIITIKLLFFPPIDL